MQSPLVDFDALETPHIIDGGGRQQSSPHLSGSSSQGHLQREMSALSALSAPTGGGDREPYPNHMHRVYYWLNTADGRSSWLFCVLVSGSVVQIPHLILGTFLTPGVTAAFADDEPVFLLFFIGCACLFFAGQTYGLFEARHTGQPGGVLDADLSVGKRALSQKSRKRLNRSYRLFFPMQPLASLCPAVGVLISVGCALTGKGIHSSGYNRASAMVWCLWPLCVAPLIFAWVFSLSLVRQAFPSCVRSILTEIYLCHPWSCPEILRVETPGQAVCHCADAVQVVIDEVNRPPPAVGSAQQRELPAHSEEEWAKKVLEPTRTLARRTIPALSSEWGHVQALAIVLCAVAACGIASLTLSPAFWGHVTDALRHSDGREHEWVHPICVAIRVIFYGLALVFMAVGLASAAGPASVTTLCELLEEVLNDIRIEQLSPEVHARLSILEQALAKLNRGQGMGYLLGMTVISTETIKTVARGLVAVASMAIPFVLQLQLKMTQSPTAGGRCALTATQVATIQAAMVGRMSTCSYHNVSLASILEISSGGSNC
jgi:hypothetical protein